MARSIANQLSPSQISGRLATFHRVMEEAGLPYDAFQWVIDDPDTRSRLVSFWCSRCCEATIFQSHARSIMGSNFFGVEEAIRHFGVNPSRQQFSALAEVPFTEAVLNEHKNTHILVAVFPMSILDIRGKVAHNAQTLFYSQDWYDNERFAKEKGQVGWELVRKTPVPGSTSKTWDEQRALLVKDEAIPTAQVMVYTIIGYFLVTGERLFDNVYVRCSNLDSDGNRLDVGNFDANGLNVNHDWDDYRHDIFGLASSWSFKPVLDL